MGIPQKKTYFIGNSAIYFNFLELQLSQTVEDMLRLFLGIRTKILRKSTDELQSGSDLPRLPPSMPIWFWFCLLAAMECLETKSQCTVKEHGQKPVVGPVKTWHIVDRFLEAVKTLKKGPKCLEKFLQNSRIFRFSIFLHIRELHTADQNIHSMSNVYCWENNSWYSKIAKGSCCKWLACLQHRESNIKSYYHIKGRYVFQLHFGQRKNIFIFRVIILSILFYVALTFMLLLTSIFSLWLFFNHSWTFLNGFGTNM